MHQIIYSLYQAKEITKKVYENTQSCRYPDLKRSDKCVALSNHCMYKTWKNKKL